MLHRSTSLSQNSPKFCVSLLVTLPVQAAHRAKPAWYPTVSIANLSGGWLFFGGKHHNIIAVHIYIFSTRKIRLGSAKNAYVHCKIIYGQFDEQPLYSN